MDNTFPIIKTTTTTQLTWSWPCCDFAAPSSGVENRRLALGWLGLRFWIIAVDPGFISGYNLLEEIWLIGIGLNLVISSCSRMSCSRSHGINFATTHFMPRSCIKISHTEFGIPRSASYSHIIICWYLLIADHTCSTFSGFLLVSGFPEHGSLSTDSGASMKHFCHTFICATLIATSPKTFWITRKFPRRNVQA